MARHYAQSVSGQNALMLSSVSNDHGKNPHTTTDRYRFIPTTQVLSVLASADWHPHTASQARANKSENQGYQKHQIRLRRSADLNNYATKNGTIPEILLTNAHGGTSAFKLMAGLFELVCSNGLIVMSEKFADASVRHVGYTDAKVRDALTQVTDHLPKVLETRNEWKEIELNKDEIQFFVESAATLRSNAETHRINPLQLTQTRHVEQAAPTVWNVFNKAQEALVKGGIRQTKIGESSYNSRRTKAITNIGENTRLNQALWAMTERFVALKNGVTFAPPVVV